jgi:hypothetical protein
MHVGKNSAGSFELRALLGVALLTRCSQKNFKKTVTFHANTENSKQPTRTRNTQRHLCQRVPKLRRIVAIALRHLCLRVPGALLRSSGVELLSVVLSNHLK